MIEDIDPVTVLDFLGVAICTLFRSLVRRANAEDLELGAYQGAVRKSIVRTYRLVFVSGWVLSMLFLFHAGSSIVSRSMVQDKLRTATLLGTPNINEKSERCEKAEVLYNFDTQRQSDLRCPVVDRMQSVLRKSLRSWMLCSLYYSVVLCLFCLLDAYFDLRKISTRSMAFVCASVLSAPLHMLWTRALISPQLPETLWSVSCLRNLLSFRTLRDLFLASLAYSCSQVIVVVGSVLTAMQLALVFRTGTYEIADLLIISAMMAVAFVCVHLPAIVLLTRVEWSLMSHNKVQNVSACTAHTLPFSEKPVARRQSRQTPLLEVVRSTDFSIFRRTLKVYSIFIAGLVSSIVLFLLC